MTQFRVLPERSQLWIDAKSSLHPIHGQAVGLEGEVEVKVDDGRLDLSVPPRGRVELPVERLTSGNALLDHEMRRRIEARKFPTITAEVLGMTASEQPNRYHLQGDLTFHGLTRRVAAEVTATLDGDRSLIVEGEYLLDVRGFGVVPPRILGLQVYPEVKVRLRLVAQQRE